MSKLIKLLPITHERSICLEEYENGTLVKDGMVKYRNVGKGFDYRHLIDANINITDKDVEILGSEGTVLTHFPKIWMDVITMRIIELQQAGVIRTE
jgi:hypothetical protein